MRCAVCSRGTSGIDFVAGCNLPGSAGTGNGNRMGAAQDPGVKKICAIEERSLTRGLLFAIACYAYNLVTLPAPGSAARQYQPTLGDGEADLFGFHMTAELFRQGGIHHIGQHGGLQSCSVRIDQEEQRIIG